MDYYHLTTDVDVVSSASEASEASEDDDPNWLIISHQSHSNDGCANNLEPAQKAPNKEVVHRRPQPQAVNGSPKRRHQNRLSRIWDGVIASYYINGGADEESVKANTAKSNVNSSSETLEAATDEKRMPSGKKSNEENLVVQRINELFESIQPPADTTANNDGAPNQILRRRTTNATHNRGRGLRQLHAVSGYFNDWAKWLTSTEAAASNPSSQQCNNSNTGYTHTY